MRDTSGPAGNRLFDICFMALLAAMALYGAVTILSAIWIPLCVGLATVAIVALAVGLIRLLIGRW